MRKKGLAALLVLIGSTAFAAGSSPTFVGDLLESVKNNPITRIFTSPTTLNESENPGLNRAIPTSEGPLKKAASSSEPIAPDIPDYVLYDMVFRLDNNFRIKAREQETNGEMPTAFEHYFKDETSLTEEEDRILEQVATEFIAEVRAIDEKAREIIAAGDKGAETAVALNNLQEERNAIVLSNRDKLANLLGGEAFERFNQFVMENFVLHFGSYEVLPN